MTYHRGWLYFVDGDGQPVELVNHARTTAYLASAANDWLGNINVADELGGCRAYGFNPVDDDGVGVWQPCSFSTPDADDTAPWYREAHQASVEFLGYWIEEWTGLDGGHVTRPVASKYPRGAAVGSIRSNERTMGMTVLVLGSTERGVEYGFRFLEDTLLNHCGSGCATSTIMLRRFCPPLTADVGSSDFIDEIEQGVVTLKRVGIVQGPVWEAPISDGAMCKIRRCTFMLVAADPCMYGLESTCADETVRGFNDLTLSASNVEADCLTWDGSEFRVSCTIATPDAGVSFPRVTVSTEPSYRGRTGIDAARASLPLRVSIYDASDGCFPCTETLLAEQTIGVPAGATEILDFAERTLTVIDPYYGAIWSAGVPDEPQEPPTEYDTFIGADDTWLGDWGCSAICVVVEPRYDAPGGVASPVEYDSPDSWSVKIETVTRIGCR